MNLHSSSFWHGVSSIVVSKNCFPFSKHQQNKSLLFLDLGRRLLNILKVHVFEAIYKVNSCDDKTEMITMARSCVTRLLAWDKYMHDHNEVNYRYK